MPLQPVNTLSIAKEVDVTILDAGRISATELLLPSVDSSFFMALQHFAVQSQGVMVPGAKMCHHPMRHSIALLAAILLGTLSIHAAPSETQKETFLSGFRMAVAANNPAMLTSLLYSQGMSRENIRSTQDGTFRRLLEKLQPYKNNLSYQWQDLPKGNDVASKVVDGIRYTTTSTPATYLEIRSGGAVIAGFFLCEEYGKLLLIGTKTDPDTTR